MIGEPVTVIDIRCGAGPYLGLRATCRRGEGAYELSLADVVFPPGSAAAAVVARYRAWLRLGDAAEPEQPLQRVVHRARPYKIGQAPDVRDGAGAPR